MGTLKQAVDRVTAAKTAIGAAITAKGGTVAAGDGLEDFAADIGTITNQYTAGDDGKVVSSGALIAQTAYPTTITENGTYDTTLNNSVMVDVSSGGQIEQKTWTGLTNFDGSSVWTDGENIYYSSSTTQYVLDKSTSNWTTKTWTGLTNFYGSYVWTDGENIYYSNNTTQKVLNNSTWSNKTWSGITSINGTNVWSDGENIYYSNGSAQYVLNKTTSTWTTKSWLGLTNFIGEYVWSDGENIHYTYLSSAGSSSTSNYYNYILDKSTSTWIDQTITSGRSFWSDGTHTYYSLGSHQFIIK